jgi:hypothetical protein
MSLRRGDAHPVGWEQKSGMVSILSGIGLVAVGGASLWYMMPTNGRTHPLAKLPILDSMIPVAIISALTIGLALIISGFL